MTRRPWVRRTDTERLHQPRSSRREDSCGFQHSSSYTFTLSAPERRAVLVRCRTLPGPKPRTVEAVIRCNHRLTGWSTRASLWPWVPQRAPIRAACSRACRRSPRAGSALRHVLQEQFLVVDIDTELGLYEGDEPDDAERVDHLLAHKRHVVADLRRRPSTGELGADEVPENVGGGHGVTTTSSGLVNDRSSASRSTLPVDVRGRAGRTAMDSGTMDLGRRETQNWASSENNVATAASSSPALSPTNPSANGLEDQLVCRRLQAVDGRLDQHGSAISPSHSPGFRFEVTTVARRRGARCGGGVRPPRPVSRPRRRADRGKRGAAPAKPATSSARRCSDPPIGRPPPPAPIG